MLACTHHGACVRDPADKLLLVHLHIVAESRPVENDYRRRQLEKARRAEHGPLVPRQDAKPFHSGCAA